MKPACQEEGRRVEKRKGDPSGERTGPRDWLHMGWDPPHGGKKRNFTNLWNNLNERGGRTRCCPKSLWKLVCKTKGKGMAHKHFILVDKLFPKRARMSNCETTQLGPGVGQWNINGWQSVSRVSHCWSGSSQVSKGRRLRKMPYGKMLMQG